MKDLSSGGLAEPAQKMHYILRLAAAMCFIGHGAFGIITKPIWCNYFAVFGIGHDLAYRLMPVVGTIDILLGLSLLLYPIRIVPAWLVIWGTTTALLRPLSGESFGELIERAGNFGTPLALLLLSGAATAKDSGSGVSRGFRGWWSRIDSHPRPDARIFARVVGCLRVVVFLLLLGHGWLNWMEKKNLLGQYTGLGFSDPVRTAHAVGLFEMLAAFAVLIRPVRPVLLALFIWKMGTELFYPHYEIFEWIERGGSYGCLLALYLSQPKLYYNEKILYRSFSF
jgi:uncharacterized membrane protein YphA (DoxX/SURF4 family)